jgi:hypothetical protein
VIGDYAARRPDGEPGTGPAGGSGGAGGEADLVRLAYCENSWFDVNFVEHICDGYLVFHPGDQQAACVKCHAWCGVLVTKWMTPDEAAALKGQTAGDRPALPGTAEGHV